MNEYLYDMLSDLNTIEYIDIMKQMKKASNNRKERKEEDELCTFVEE